jgi:hypothetical protein
VLEFEPVAHVYRWGGVLVPSVTQVLKPLTDFSMIAVDVLERARAEGVEIHRMIELDCSDNLDSESLPEWIRPYWAAWQKFKVETGFEVVASERQMYHPTLRYAGTCDLVGRVPKISRAGLALIDVKRSLFAGPVIGLQLAAYAALWDCQPSLERIKQRFAFQPRKDSTYRLPEFTDTTDRMTFQALLTVHKWRMNHAK